MPTRKPFSIIPITAIVASVITCMAATTEQFAERIVVNKAKRELILYRSDKAIRTYRVALGAQPVGAKQCEGDNKTPEGSYTISGRNSASSYHLSLRVSYPNDADIARAKRDGVSPGGDIMIHGLPNGRGFIGAAHRLRDWTAGCIAVTDAEIEEIWRLVPDGTPIQINP
jgi:murein L,D-transpeptidase YafK